MRNRGGQFPQNVHWLPSNQFTAVPVPCLKIRDLKLSNNLPCVLLVAGGTAVVVTSATRRSDQICL